MKRGILATAAAVAAGVAGAFNPDTSTQTANRDEKAEAEAKKKAKARQKEKAKRGVVTLRPWQVPYYAARIPAEDPEVLTRQIIRRRKRIRAKTLRHDDKMAALRNKTPGGAAVVRDLTVY